MRKMFIGDLRKGNKKLVVLCSVDEVERVENYFIIAGFETTSDSDEGLVMIEIGHEKTLLQGALWTYHTGKISGWTQPVQVKLRDQWRKLRASVVRFLGLLAAHPDTRYADRRYRAQMVLNILGEDYYSCKSIYYTLHSAITGAGDDLLAEWEHETSYFDGVCEAMLSDIEYQDAVSRETCYADTDSVHTPENVNLGSKWSRLVIEDAALNYGFAADSISEFIRLFESKFELETGWCYDSDTAEAILYGPCAVKHADFFTNDEMSNALWDKCFESAAEQLEVLLEDQDPATQPTPEAEEVAERIREKSAWDFDDCAELCHLAGLDIEWEEADGCEFEGVVYEAARKLGVEL